MSVQRLFLHANIEAIEFLLGVPCPSSPCPQHGTDPSAEGNTSGTSLSKWQTLIRAEFCLLCQHSTKRQNGTKKYSYYFQQLNQGYLPAQVFRYLLKFCISWSLNIGDTFLIKKKNIKKYKENIYIFK